MSCMYAVLVIIYQIIRRHNAENQSLHQNEHDFQIPCLESCTHAWNFEIHLSKPCSVLDSLGASQKQMAGCSEQEKENYLAPYVAENFIVRCENVCLFNTTPTHGGNVVSLGNSAMAVIRYFGHNGYEAPGHTSSS